MSLILDEAKVVEMVERLLSVRQGFHADAPLVPEVARALGLCPALGGRSEPWKGVEQWMRKHGLAVRRTPERNGFDDWVVRVRVCGFTNQPKFEKWLAKHCPAGQRMLDARAVERALGGPTRYKASDLEVTFVKFGGCVMGQEHNPFPVPEGAAVAAIMSLLLRHRARFDNQLTQRAFERRQRCNVLLIRNGLGVRESRLRKIGLRIDTDWQDVEIVDVWKFRRWVEKHHPAALVAWDAAEVEAALASQ